MYVHDYDFSVFLISLDPMTPNEPRPIDDAVSAFTIGFEWDPTTGTNFTSYRVYNRSFSFRRTLVKTIEASSSDTTYTEWCLRPSSRYTFEIELFLEERDEFGNQTSDEAQSIQIWTGKLNEFCVVFFTAFSTL